VSPDTADEQFNAPSGLMLQKRQLFRTVCVSLQTRGHLFRSRDAGESDMSVRSPQQIPAELDPRVFSIWKGAMGTLVGPKVNGIVAGIVPKLIEAVEGSVSGGGDVQARACLSAGLWLLADDLPKAHAICQDIPTAYGSAWHAHLHRREGDFSNSKYWWRRASGVKWQAPGDEPLQEQVAELLTNPPVELLSWRSDVRKQYDPSKFVDVVEKFPAGEGRIGEILVATQRLEWACLFLECYAAARGDKISMTKSQ
jgi:hypothetical protein